MIKWMMTLMATSSSRTIEIKFQPLTIFQTSSVTLAVVGIFIFSGVESAMNLLSSPNCKFEELSLNPGVIWHICCSFTPVLWMIEQCFMRSTYCSTYIHFLVADDDWYLCHFSRPCSSAPPTRSFIARQPLKWKSWKDYDSVQYFHSISKCASLFCPLQNKRNKGSFRSSIRSLNNSDDDLSVSFTLKLISPRFCFWAIVVLVPISHSRKSGQELWAVGCPQFCGHASIRGPWPLPFSGDTVTGTHRAVPLSYCDKSVSPQNTPPVYVAAWGETKQWFQVWE